MVTSHFSGHNEAIYRLLGTPVRIGADEIALHESILSDIGVHSVFTLAEQLAIPIERLAESVNLTVTQLYVRDGRRDSLDVYQADQVFRVAYVGALASDVFTDAKEAGAWMTNPQRGLGERVPLVLLKTYPGTMTVTQLLERLKRSFYA